MTYESTDRSSGMYQGPRMHPKMPDGPAPVFLREVWLASARTQKISLAYDLMLALAPVE